jgi:hypothetical protein
MSLNRTVLLARLVLLAKSVLLAKTVLAASGKAQNERMKTGALSQPHRHWTIDLGGVLV